MAYLRRISQSMSKQESAECVIQRFAKENSQTGWLAPDMFIDCSQKPLEGVAEIVQMV